MFAQMAQPSTQRQRQPHQLPPGRHGLPREFVVGNQRQRILAAVAEAVSEVGYAAMTVEDIIRVAGVSRRTFYEHFKSKEEAFLVSYDDISAQLMDAVVAAFDRTDAFITRVEDCMRAYLTLLAAQPAYANMCIVEVLVAGPTAIGRRNAVMRQFMELIDRGADEELPRTGRPPPLTSETLVGGDPRGDLRARAEGRDRPAPRAAAGPDLLGAAAVHGTRRRDGPLPQAAPPQAAVPAVISAARRRTCRAAGGR